MARHVPSPVGCTQHGNRTLSLLFKEGRKRGGRKRRKKEGEEGRGEGRRKGGQEGM